MPTPPSIRGRPRSALHTGRPVEASKAKKLSPSSTLLPTKTRPPATAGVPEGGSGPRPTKACQRGASRATISVLRAASPAFTLVREGSCPYIGHSLGGLGVGLDEGGGSVAEEPQAVVNSARTAAPPRPRRCAARLRTTVLFLSPLRLLNHGRGPKVGPPGRATIETARRRRLNGGPGVVTSPSGTDPIPPIGRYEILRELGRGAMGVVYEARDPALSRNIALKAILPVPVGEKEAFEARFFEEARIAARLSHPGIVVVHDVGRDPASGVLYIALEHLRGQTLEELAQAGPLDWREVCRLGAQIARALYHAHERSE